MAARGNLVLTDRNATPVAHTFTPDGDDVNGVHLYSEKVTVPAGNPRFSAKLARSNGKVRSTLRLQVPVVVTTTSSGVESFVISRTAFVEVNCTFDELSTEQERKDAIGMIASSLAASEAQINGLLTQATDIW